MQKQCDDQTQYELAGKADNQEKECSSQGVSKRVVLKDRNVVLEPAERGVVNWPDAQKIPMPVDFREKELVK
jgi:hypothetical protein